VAYDLLSRAVTVPSFGPELAALSNKGEKTMKFLCLAYLDRGLSPQCRLA